MSTIDFPRLTPELAGCILDAQGVCEREGIGPSGKEWATFIADLERATWVDGPTPLDSALSHVVLVHAELRRLSAAGYPVKVLCEWEHNLEDARHAVRVEERYAAAGAEGSGS